MALLLWPLCWDELAAWLEPSGNPCFSYILLVGSGEAKNYGSVHCICVRSSFFCEKLFQGQIIYAPLPLHTIFGQKAFFRGRGGGGLYFEPPPRQDFYTPPPLFLRPPTPRRVFSGVGAWGCIKFGPPVVVLSACCFIVFLLLLLHHHHLLLMFLPFPYIPSLPAYQRAHGRA